MAKVRILVIFIFLFLNIVLVGFLSISNHKSERANKLKNIRILKSKKAFNGHLFKAN
ncbi:hypothetical protein HPSA50_1298 [Helicobacter pylori SouthAfrica50]|uniref:Uncharacterized protein n=1 Tax=Helicobacter pylori SouthAfrica50 TaxID=1352357 RepID=T2S8Q2_HELPX|nr:hypothetical protein HPSA50_1298 [Helicobacter pylori SouthAfrica50]